MPHASPRTLLAAALVAVAGGSLAACGDGRPNARWGLIGSGADGRSIVIRPLAGCPGDRDVDLRKSNANEVELAVKSGDDVRCTQTGTLPPPITVKLATPLRGPEIHGPGHIDPQPVPARAGEPVPYPSLVGLRVPDAMAVLEANGARVARVTLGPTDAQTEVNFQSPAAGTPIPAAEAQAGEARKLPDATIRTVPR